MVCLRESLSLYLERFLRQRPLLPLLLFPRKRFRVKSWWDLAVFFKALFLANYEISLLYRSGKAISRSSQMSDAFAIGEESVG